MGEIVKCACGNHTINLADENTVNIDGKYWRATCAVIHLSTRTNSQSAKIDTLSRSLLTMREQVAQLGCGHCEYPVGKNCQFFGNQVYCAACSAEHGGEG